MGDETLQGATDQGFSDHEVPFDIVVKIIAGEAEITIGGQPQDEIVAERPVLSVNIADAFHAETPYKGILK